MKSKIALIGAAALMGGLLAAPTPASAQGSTNTLTIELQHFLTTAPAESQRFMAPEAGVTVHKGDVLNFVGGFGTVVAIPKNSDPVAWLQQHASFGGDFALQVPDSDEGPTNLKYNNNVIFPTAQNCGPPALSAPPCPYTGDTALGSGVLFFVTSFNEQTGQPAGGFSMAINANSGDFFYLVDPVNPTITPLKVTVVGNNDATTTQTDINTAASALAQQDEQTASSLDTQYRNAHTFTRENGHKVWDVYVGVDGPGVSLFDMYPSKVTLKKGDKIQAHFDQLAYEFHTFTLPKTLAVAINTEDFDAVCDPDGSGSAPDTDADESTGRPVCPSGSTVEIDSTPRLTQTIGDGIETGGNDQESSGVRSPNLPSPPTAGGAPFFLKFGSHTAGKTFKFDCAIHTDMVGKVVVKPRR